MALDVLTYSKENEVLGTTKISEKFHHAVFNNDFVGTCKTLRKIKDYYKTNLKLSTKEDISNFVADLKYIRQFIGTDYLKELDALASFIDNKRVYSVRITGD